MSTEIVLASSMETAYQRAYEEHWHDVFRFALAWTNDWAAAEDLAQESYLRLWNSRTRVDWERPLLPWLLVTTRRLATDRFRALRRRVLKAPKSTTLDEAVWDRWLDVQAAMASLSPLERTALVLTAVEGIPYADAATMLGTSAGALRAAVSRARDKLEVA
ncbi:MAG: RNA polymerase sigma factor [Candidatus Limnocylindrales bacterium]